MSEVNPASALDTPADSPAPTGTPSYRYDNESGNYYDQRGAQVDPRVAEAASSATGAQAAQKLVGIPAYSGKVSQGRRGEGTGENSFWGIDPRTGKEVPVLTMRNGEGVGQNYLLSDLMQKYGSLDAIAALGRDPGADIGDGTNSEAGKGVFETSLSNFSARPSDDPFTGKAAPGELLTIAGMAAPVIAGAAGAAYGTSGAAAGTGTAGAAMPPAQALTASELSSMGLTATSPGVFETGGGTGGPSTPIGTPGGDDVLPGGGGTDELSVPSQTPPPAEAADNPFPQSANAQTPTAGTPTVSDLPVGGGGAGVDVPVGNELIKEPPGTPPNQPPSAPKPTLSERAMSAISGNPLMAGALGLNVLGQVNANRRGKDAASQLREVSAPTSAASKQLIEQGMAGQVPPAIMAQFDKSLNERVGEIRQRYANMGRDAKTDSAAQTEISKAIATRDAQVAQYAQSLITQGLQAAGVSAGPQTAAIQAGAAKDAQLQNAMGGTLQSMALLEQLRRGQPTTTTPPAS